MYKTEHFKLDDFKPTRFESTGKVTLHGQEISYKTVAEDNVFYGADGKAIASIYSYSYFRTDVADTANRPEIFCYNGGPRSSSYHVHAGFMGLKRIKYGEPDRPSAVTPYEVIDNPDCLLDIADIVVVDPVGTGYGILLNEECGKQFYGIEEDAEALLTFVEQWMHRYNRWLSPKYLCGESYGCTRSAVAAGISATNGKERSYGIAFDGIIFIGNTVTVGKYFGREVPVEPSVTAFPTYAANHWYHNHPTEQPLEEFVYEAKAFADREYLLALYQGEALTGEGREAVIAKITHYTGMTKEYLEANGLRIEPNSFRAEVIKDSGRVVARYDGRITRPRLIPENVETAVGSSDDASSDRWSPYFFAATTGAILPSLNVSLERQYVASSRACGSAWNRESPAGTTGVQLRNAMHRTPGMRCFFANGWYDNCTVTGHIFYTVDHAGLPKERICFKGYESGHMIYIGEENCHTLCEDIRTFVLGGMPGKTF